VVGNARSGIRILYSRRNNVGGKAPPLHENVKVEVKMRENILSYVRRGGESDRLVGVGVTLEVGSA